jgi:hypothetical protein
MAEYDSIVYILEISLKLICMLSCIGVMIWLLAVIYFISGVPGAYVLWYRPLYNAMRLCICFCVCLFIAHYISTCLTSVINMCITGLKVL